MSFDPTPGARVLTMEGRDDELKIGPWTGRNLSGYVVLKKGPFNLIFDTAILGPDYCLARPLRHALGSS